MSVIVKNVSKYYGQQKALDDLSFDVREGEVLALLGPNGAGKSSMMRIVVAYMLPSSGSVKVCGHDAVEEPLEVKRQVGYLPENNPLYPDMYVREYLLFVAGVYGLGKRARGRTDEMIELTGLEAEYRKPIGKLSKGYRQRVGLAQALIHDPRVLILDEPTSGLDPNQLAEIRQLIRQIGAHKTVILSTHIMQEVEAVCSRVIIINKGKLMADASTREARLLNRASQVVYVEFDKAPQEAQLKTLEGVVDLVGESRTSFRIYTRDGRDIRRDLFQHAVDKGLVILSMEREEQSLEEVFRSMTLSQ